MTTIYFVRHGATENKGQIIYGRMPGFNLSEEGRKEAEKIGEMLADKGVKNIYTSPLERAFQTAEIISNHLNNSVITHTFDLNEVESSSWQGLPPDELFKNNSYEMFANDPNADIGTENLNQLAQRMKNITQQIVKLNKGGSAVCVSHELPILILKFSYENKPLVNTRNYHLLTGSITKFDFDENDNFVSTETLDKF